MNPYTTLQIPPTVDKMVIRRAYVTQTKVHHPDNGGDTEQFMRVQEAYDLLINKDLTHDLLVDEIPLSLNDLMKGCIATAIIGFDGVGGSIVEFQVPPYTFPGTYIEFYDKASTHAKIRVKILESQTDAYTRMDTSIIFRRQINKRQALKGLPINIVNFDGNTHTVTISPDTTANRLIFHIPGEGFYEHKSCVRGNLTIIVEIE